MRVCSNVLPIVLYRVSISYSHLFFFTLIVAPNAVCTPSSMGACFGRMDAISRPGLWIPHAGQFNVTAGAVPFQHGHMGAVFFTGRGEGGMGGL